MSRLDFGVSFDSQPNDDNNTISSVNVDSIFLPSQTVQVNNALIVPQTAIPLRLAYEFMKEQTKQAKSKTAKVEIVRYVK